MSTNKTNGGAPQGGATSNEQWNNTPAAGQENSNAAATQQAGAGELLGKVTRKGEFLCKRGPSFAYNGKDVDLRKITDATAVALANDPRCMFIVWKDKAKRPEGQRIQNEDVYVKA